jgi:signal peptidase I
MFSFLSSEETKMRRNAENWLRLCEKVYHYRRDQLKEKELQELLGASNQLREALRKKEDASRLRLASEQAENILRRVGGAYYRKAGWTDNVEVFLVAAILAIGIRTYFVQPFKIPTNSMWPSYFGMTHETFEAGEEPGGVERAFRSIAYGARRYTVNAPISGEVQIAILRDRLRLAASPATMRRYFFLPAPAVEYILFVDGVPVGVRVPAEFQIEPVLRDAFFPEAPSLEGALADRARAGVRSLPGYEQFVLIGTGVRVEAGEPLVNFDILTGDQLFVDRMSYHFVRPKVGDGIVFRTGLIPGLRGPTGAQEDKYYIKRLVGIPGDELEIRTPVLLRNGAPIDGRPVFEKMNAAEGRFTGYLGVELLAPGRTVTVPPERYFALGDNSPNSLDSRSWGFVPQEEIVGRSLLIYYPFTRRWGPAR